MKALAEFKGVKRRQEIIGEPNGITLVEDFAHHPTAVQSMIESMREFYKGRRLISVFEPRSATSRRKVFQRDYVQALKGSDIVVIPQPVQMEKIPVEQRFSSEQLVRDLNQEGGQAFLEPDAEAIVQFLSREARRGDVVLIMSNGGFDGIYGKLLKALS